MPARTLFRRQRLESDKVAVEGARKFPDARCSLENGAAMLPLVKGENEIAVALANDCLGWGMVLRVTDPEGVRLAAKRLRRPTTCFGV